MMKIEVTKSPSKGPIGEKKLRTALTPGKAVFRRLSTQKKVSDVADDMRMALAREDFLSI